MRIQMPDGRLVEMEGNEMDKLRLMVWLEMLEARVREHVKENKRAFFTTIIDEIKQMVEDSIDKPAHNEDECKDPGITNKHSNS